MLLWLSFVLIDMKLSTAIDILMHWLFRFWLTWKWRVAFDVNIFSWSYIIGKLLLFPVVQCLLSYFLFESWVWDIKYFLAIKVSRFTHSYYVCVQRFSSSFLTTSFVCIRAVISSRWSQHQEEYADFSCETECIRCICYLEVFNVPVQIRLA